ncbi:putative ribonuclease H-like domain-containing protein [Tanacetum coccineum]
MDHEDLEQIDEFDLEEIDLKWQVAMISMRLKKFYKKTGKKLHFDAKELVGFDKTKVECYKCHKTGHFARECRLKGNQDARRRDAGNSGYKAKDNRTGPGKQEESKALITLDGEGIDWTAHEKDEEENFALMAFSNLGSDTEVTSCSKECVESYTKLKKLYDEQREQLGDASIEIQAYTQALKKVEAQLVAYQQNQLWYEEKIRFMKIDLDDKTDMSVRDKAGLGYGDQMHEGILSYENKVFQSVFNSRSSDTEDSPVNDRYAEGMHVVPPPMTAIYIPSGPNKEINESQYTYGPKQYKPSESDTRSSDFNSCKSNSSKETLESIPELVVNEPKVVIQPKFWSDAPIIEEYESDSDDDYVSTPSKEHEPSFAFVSTDKHVKTPRETVKNQHTYSQNPKVDKKDWNGLMSKRLGLGYGFAMKAYFVYGSFSHLITDCDFHEKRIAKQAELNERVCKGTGQRENRPVWNNVQRVNHQNKFVSTAVLTRTGKILVNTARASSINKINTAGYKAVSAVGGIRKTAIKPSTDCVWRPKKNYLKNVPVPLDHFPINALTSKVLTLMVKKGKKILGDVTPLFDSMLVQPTKDEGDVSKRPSESQPIPSPPYPSEDQPESQHDSSPRPSPSIPTPDSNLEGSGGNHGAKEIKDLKARIKQLKKKARPGRKTAKSKPTAHKDQAFDDLDDHDIMDYMETEDAHNEEKTSSKTEELKTSSKTKELNLSGDTVVLEEKDSVEKGVSTEDQVSTVKPDEGTNKPKVSTDKIDEGTAEPKDGNSDESATPTAPTTTSTPTPIVFGDDETIAEFLISMSQNKAKQKGVEIKDTEETDRPRSTSTRYVLTLKPLPEIDPNDKGKKVFEQEEAESDAKSEGVNEAERKFDQLANDEDIAKKVQEEWEAEEEKKRLAKKEATKAALIRDYDDIRARIDADSILVAKLQKEERENFTIEERARLLHDTIAAQRRFLAQLRATEIRSRPPTRTQLIRELNKKVIGIKKADSIKEESKEEEGTRKRKLGTRKKMKSRKRRFRQDTSEGDSEKENDELRLCLTIAPDEDKEVDYEILDKKYPITEWKTEYLEDLNAVYQLVMDRYQDEVPKGVHTLMTEAGLVIHLLVEKKYPLKKKVLLQMLELKLESEEDSTMALELIRFVKKLIAELELDNSDGDEEDL